MSIQFWPKEENSYVKHGSITIQCIKNNDLFEYYNIQTLKVFFKNKEREIKHVHLKWDLDLEWTFYPNHLLSFVKETRNCCKEFLHPILFYSDFGINGTGTLILTDMALHMIEEENCVDFLKLTKFLKYQRHNIINTEQQYVLSHLIVSEYLLQETNIFEINSEAFTNEKTITYYPEDLKKQLPYFQKLWEFDTVFQSWLQSQQTLKNCSATSSYTYVDGYGKRNKYLVLQQPNQVNLSDDFWITLAEIIENSKDADNSDICVLLFNKLEQDVWPPIIKDKYLKIGTTKIKSEEESYYYLTTINLQIQNEISKTVQIKTVLLYQLKQEGHLSRNIAILFSVTKRFIKDLIVVANSNNSLNLCGIFIIMAYVINKYEKESVIDVYTAIRTSMRSGTCFIKNFKELKHLYLSITEYLKGPTRTNRVSFYLTPVIDETL